MSSEKQVYTLIYNKYIKMYYYQNMTADLKGFGTLWCD